MAGLLETVPAPAGNGQVSRHPGTWWRIREDLADRPFHVRAEAGAEIGVIGKARIARCLDETGDESSPQILVGSLAGVDAEHPRMADSEYRGGPPNTSAQ